MDSSLTALVEAIARDPAGSALLLDFDGTLAPIVARPDDACLIDGARAPIEVLRDRLGVVAFISGRRLADLERRVGIEGITYVGNHGMEFHTPHGTPTRAAGVDEWRPALDAFISDQRVDGPACGVEIEDKGATLSVHWRNAADTTAAETWLREVRRRDAEQAGLRITWGRAVMEVRPPVRVDKGTGAARVVVEAGARMAVFVGDDHTDADAWRVLRAMQDATQLKLGAGVAVVSPETPEAVLAAAAARLAGPSAVVEFLEALVSATDG